MQQTVARNSETTGSGAAAADEGGSSIIVVFVVLVLCCCAAGGVLLKAKATSSGDKPADSGDKFESSLGEGASAGTNTRRPPPPKPPARPVSQLCPLCTARRTQCWLALYH